MVVLLPVVVFSAITIAETAKKREKQRHYDDGPLKIKEFAGDSPRFTRLEAMTVTRVALDYKFRVSRAGTGYRATLKSLSVKAVFLPNESWWRAPHDEALLDHEQGHFDIAEIAARRLRLAFRKLLRGSRKLSATGDTAEEAGAALVAKLEKVNQISEKQTAIEHEEYDRTTLHGVRYGTQAEQRRIHKLTLEKLKNELDGKRRSKPADPATEDVSADDAER